MASSISHDVHVFTSWCWYAISQQPTCLYFQQRMSKHGPSSAKKSTHILRICGGEKFDFHIWIAFTNISLCGLADEMCCHMRHFGYLNYPTFQRDFLSCDHRIALGSYLWSLRWSWRLKALPHISQEYGRSSVCVLSWINRLYDFVKCLWQYLQINSFLALKIDKNPNI